MTTAKHWIMERVVQQSTEHKNGGNGTCSHDITRLKALEPPTMRPSLPTTLLIAALPFTTAQNSTTNSTCSNPLSQTEIDRISSTTFNSTGSTSFSWTNPVARDLSPWYFSILLNDTIRGRNFSTSDSIKLYPFLSTGPDVRNASVCIYQFSPQNATSTGSGANNTGCAGVLSDACTNYLREALTNATSHGALPGDSCGALSTLPADIQRRNEACGEGKLTSIIRSKLTPKLRVHIVKSF
jgi:hypothetical protein